MPQRLMGTDLVVLLAPILKQSVCLQQILRDLPQDFLLHGAVKALDLPLGLWMADPAVDGQNIQIHEVALELRDALPKASKLRPVI